MFGKSPSPHSTFLPVAALLLTTAPLTSLSAQFSADFTTSEGYFSGPLGSNDDWNVFDQSQLDGGTFLVDTSGSGTLTIDPEQTGFQGARFTGPGASLGTNAYSVELRFMVKFTEGSNSEISNSVALPSLYLRDESNNELVGFALRHISPFDGDGNVFNIFTVNSFNGSPSGAFSEGFSGTEIGLSTDSYGNWTDGESDALILRFSAIYLGEGQWEETATLLSASGAYEIASTSRTVTDSDDSFAALKHYFQIASGNMTEEAVAVVIDALSLETVPVSQ